jgi:hypothetical protein
MMHTKDLGVATSIVGHPHHADGPNMNPASREGGVLGEHEDIERIAVFGKRVRDKSVLGWVGGGGKEAAI